jgi:hypothetical protein
MKANTTVIKIEGGTDVAITVPIDMLITGA